MDRASAAESPLGTARILGQRIALGHSSVDLGRSLAASTRLVVAIFPVPPYFERHIELALVGQQLQLAVSLHFNLNLGNNSETQFY